MKELLSYLAVRAAFVIFGVLPHRVRVYLFTLCWRAVFILVPKLKNIAITNLEIAFPLESAAWRRNLLKANAVELGRLIADTVRLSSLDAEWVREHVEIPALGRYKDLASKGGGVLIATGHLGSFELLGHAIGLWGYPVAAIARNFKSPRLDRWWRGLREARGNRIIDRTGAFKEMVKELTNGGTVAVLFDQNVRLHHAVFVDWFGKPAATTRAFALAALKCRAPVMVAGMSYLGGDERYRVDAVECDFSGLYDDESLSEAQKIEVITREISERFTVLIRKFPQGWFWIHRRWKTRPDGDSEQVYR
jgi:KDO2-lipid IV(A) lauroyltransferase